MMGTVACNIPPTAELFTKSQLVARHPHLLSANRVTWALRHRAANGLSGAVFDSPCGELLIHEPTFLAWFLGLKGQSKPRTARPPKLQGGGGAPFSGTHRTEKANRGFVARSTRVVTAGRS